ncbi:hypothetical protein CcaverHIS002_0410740 [Cutaneotrichosporon cavernicola]|uniref:NAD-dependent protein deacetylase n=1 Tax=Cutaneotrichosporon cavernicola TaxID=279322 RepID=A0AA48L5A3_9TREE|nr:uncharacterized protein CcaverHIS019_0410640 [Cutaneotrichosporon cavernicola]BEI84470.1 hypothetical protein CcaverHIS002_0410740 [Cutaneotrichosporon cavernicola]BEI92244.1 hypothetical protein CcaverHIS019_0410640 [Cutaneotrichosporon cavernicola]BEJ00016.1 hypothetical protein CcaverHIS631_0410580 [Cutaneotrichosporon cavernicola]BEJ07788.1 hypothetical protein CcaverHIS641_0410570 [Cutaneotrichosporon cavernicola]
MKSNDAIEHAASLIRDGKARKIAVMTGAGISTSAGIPDFRSPGTGLYDNLQALDLPVPEAVFSLDYFHYRPEPFWTLAKDLYPGKYFPTPTHYFLKLLHDKGVLQRVWSQNIDTLETAAGVPPDLVMEAHGSFRTAHCLKCRRSASTEYVLKAGVRQGAVVRCEHCKGLVKPDIVFFGEGLPDNFFELMPELRHADLVLVMGTSLQVHPFAGLVERVSSSTPRVLINREAVGPFSRVKHGKRRGRDGVYLGDADDAVRELVRAIGWEEELDELIAEGQKRLETEWKAMGATEMEVEAEDSKAKEEAAGEDQSDVAPAVEAEAEAKNAPKDAGKDAAAATDKMAEGEPLLAAAKAIEAETAKDAALENEVEALTSGLAGVKVDDKAKV